MSCHSIQTRRSEHYRHERNVACSTAWHEVALENYVLSEDKAPPTILSCLHMSCCKQTEVQSGQVGDDFGDCLGHRGGHFCDGLAHLLGCLLDALPNFLDLSKDVV